MMPNTAIPEWLLIFYSVPSQPVSNRMKIWRKLSKAGAVQLKGAVYILPATEEHEEFLQWLIGEVKSMGGDGAFVRTAEVKTMTEADIRDLFLSQAEEGYRGFEKNLDALELKVQSFRKGALGDEGGKLADLAKKLAKELDEHHKRDFFSSPLGIVMQKRMQALAAGLRGIGRAAAETPAAIKSKRVKDYQDRVWATRKKPFIDRMASAWLIKRFIDPNASFLFIEEHEIAGLEKRVAAFDVRGAEFTHVGELCTFEVLIKSFGIKDKTVRKIAEIVHDLDVTDETYENPEAAGMEGILSGIRKTMKSDADALERGMAVFEMLYKSKS